MVEERLGRGEEGREERKATKGMGLRATSVIFVPVVCFCSRFCLRIYGLLGNTRGKKNHVSFLEASKYA